MQDQGAALRWACPGGCSPVLPQVESGWCTWVIQCPMTRGGWASVVYWFSLKAEDGLKSAMVTGLLRLLWGGFHPASGFLMQSRLPVTLRIRMGPGHFPFYKETAVGWKDMGGCSQLPRLFAHSSSQLTLMQAQVVGSVRCLVTDGPESQTS